MEYLQGELREQTVLFKTCIDDMVPVDNTVRLIDQFVDALNLKDMGFKVLASKGRLPYNPADLLKLYIYGYMNRMCSSRVLEKECQRNIEVIWLMKNLTAEQQAWFNNFDNRTLRDEIKNYLKTNLFSELAKSFASLAVEAFKQNADFGYNNQVDFEDQIINNLTNSCAKSIFIQLENGLFEDHPLKPEIQVPVSNPLTLNFSESILKLFNDSDNSHLTIQNGNAGDANANTVKTNITISDTYLANATQLSIARTMIHESVHAYLNGIYYSYPDFENKPFRDKLNKYATDKGFTDMNTFHHNFMGQYINAMAYSLYEWDKDYGTGGNLDWNYYKSMAYSGMFQVDPSGNIATEIDNFKELVPNASDRQAIADIILNEQNGNNDAKGTKCD